MYAPIYDQFMFGTSKWHMFWYLKHNMFGVCKYLYDWNTRKLLGVLWISWDVVAFSNPMELILVFKIIYFHDYFLVKYFIYTALNITTKQLWNNNMPMWIVPMCV